MFNAKKLRHDWLQAKKNLTKCEEREKGIFADINTLCSNVNDSIGFMHHRVTTMLISVAPKALSLKIDEINRRLNDEEKS